MKKRPNIVVFMTDQQNGDTIGGGLAKTPNIDAFLEQSMQLTEAFTASPHCCPSRATFFSGLYCSQHGIWNNVEEDNALSRGLYDGVKLFPQYLKEAGYHTYFSGKWHVSAYEGPESRGFDYVLNEYISNYGRFEPENKPRSMAWEHVYAKQELFDLGGDKKFGEIRREGYPNYHQFGVDENPFGDTTTVGRACEVIKTYDDEQPFFLYVGTTGPHDPYYPPQEFIDLYRDEKIELPVNYVDDMEDKPGLYRRTRDRFCLSEAEHIESIRRYLAFVSYEDALFGKLVDTIREKGIYEDTYIFYLTDHGDYMGAHGLWAKGLPCFREAYHICAAVGGGNIREKGVCNDLVALADFAPTILDLAGCGGYSFSGKSLVPILEGKHPYDWRTELFTQTNGNEIYGIQRAVWNREWKYVYNSFDYDELYHLTEDPYEMKNLASDPGYKETIRAMCIKMWAFAKETGDNCICPYIMVSLAPYGPGILLGHRSKCKE